MAYTKNTWVDQDVERPKTYEVTKNQDGSITLTDSFGLVKELGTPVNAVNMNHIEDGIDGCAIRKHNLTETFNLGEWVLGGTGDDEGIYKSLIANNVGNALTDRDAWEKATDLNGKADTDLSNVTDTGYIKMAGAGMPSSRYIDLTLGASGTTYTAPANGYFTVYSIATQNTSWIDLTHLASYLKTHVIASTNGWGTGIYMPAIKGQDVSLSYKNKKIECFRFIYAVGSQPA